MRSWSVTARGLAGVQVQGRNWIVALGRGLEELGRAADVSRLACEVLPNGTVIARDIASGTGYIVQGVGDDEDLPVPTADPGAPPGEAEEQEIFGEPEEDELLADEEGNTEPIYELPPEAIAELEPADDAVLATIDRAETTLMACQLVLTESLKRVPAESGAVILEERGYLRFCAVSGPHARKLMGVRLPMGTGVAGFAMEKRRTVVLADAHTDPRHCGEVDALTGYVTKEIAVLPVVHGDSVLGVVELMNLADGRRFSEAEVEALQQVVDALAARLSR